MMMDEGKEYKFFHGKSAWMSDSVSPQFKELWGMRIREGEGGREREGEG